MLMTKIQQLYQEKSRDFLFDFPYEQSKIHIYIRMIYDRTNMMKKKQKSEMEYAIIDLSRKIHKAQKKINDLH